MTARERTRTRIGRCALVLLLVACTEEAPPPELPPRAIQWIRISEDAGEAQRVISGIVTAVDTTKLAFEVGGNVATVDVVLGQKVDAGQVLARLDPEPLRLAVDDARASLAEARALAQEAQVNFDRAQALLEAEVASAAERDRALARRDSTKSQVAAARARLDLAERDLRRSELTAPFQGVISVEDVDPAQEVRPGQVVFEMDSGESGLRVEVQMPETLIARVSQGDAATVRFPSLELTDEEAFISEVGTRAGAGNAFTVKADLVDPPAQVRPGMTAEVVFSYGPIAEASPRFQGFMIPFAAVVPEADERFSVFVYDRESGTVRKRAVEVGGVRDNDVAIFSGLEEGDIIATAGASFLREDQQVTLLGVER